MIVGLRVLCVVLIGLPGTVWPITEPTTTMENMNDIQLCSGNWWGGEYCAGEMVQVLGTGFILGLFALQLTGGTTMRPE